MIVVDVDGKQSVLKLEPMNLRLNQIQEIIEHNREICFLVDENGINKNLPKNSHFLGFFGKVCIINFSDLN